jgi:hypothetical protein
MGHQDGCHLILCQLKSVWRVDITLVLQYDYAQELCRKPELEENVELEDHDKDLVDFVHVYWCRVTRNN